jgi:hypothetical protein
MRYGRSFQQQRLTVHFVHRFVDHEMLAAGGDPRQIFVNAFALSGASGLTLAVLFALRYFYRINELAEPLRQLALADDRQLLILLTATLTGLFTVLAWETLLPDRKDAFVLGSLPVEPGVILRAKLSAALLYFAVLQGVFQLFLLAFPAVAGAADWLTLLRGMAIQSYILWSAGVSVFFGAMALQGCLSLLLPYRWFLRVSSVAQFCWLLAALSVTFCVPPVELAPAAGAWARWAPTSWFLDAWQAAAGGRPVYAGMPVAGPALIAGSCVLLAAGSLRLGFRRILRSIVEGASMRRRGPSRAAALLNRFLGRTLLRDPREAAVFRFAWRTILRHRNSRLMLAMFGGMALCWTLFSLAEAMRHGAANDAAPSALLLSIPLDFSFLLLLGMRVMFGMPVELPASWAFRIAPLEWGQPAFRASRKLLFLSGCLPLVALLAPGYLALWGPGIAFRHTVLVLLAGWLIADIMSNSFRRMPFASAWLPGRANLKVTLGAWVLLFTSLSWMVGALEAAAVRTFAGTLLLAAILLAATAWCAWRRRQEPARAICWEDLPHPVLQLLHLER